MKLYHNPEESTATEKKFGDLQVKAYKGTNSALRKIAEQAKEEKRKYIGTASFIKRENAWYVYPFNAESREDGYRLPEPSEGIDTILDLEFKRTSTD